MQEKLKKALVFCIQETENQIMEYYEEALDHKASHYMLGCADAVKDITDEFDRLY